MECETIMVLRVGLLVGWMVLIVVYPRLCLYRSQREQSMRGMFSCSLARMTLQEYDWEPVDVSAPLSFACRENLQFIFYILGGHGGMNPLSGGL